MLHYSILDWCRHSQGDADSPYTQQNSITHVYISAEQHRPGSGDPWEWRPVTSISHCTKYCVVVRFTALQHIPWGFVHLIALRYIAHYWYILLHYNTLHEAWNI